MSEVKTTRRARRELARTAKQARKQAARAGEKAKAEVAGQASEVLEKVSRRAAKAAAASAKAAAKAERKSGRSRRRWPWLLVLGGAAAMAVYVLRSRTPREDDHRASVTPLDADRAATNGAAPTERESNESEHGLHNRN
jgi:membrane protein involved in colicin uptake